MANTIIIKKSSTAGAVPTAASLQPGELAVNLADRKLYSKTTGGSVIEVGNGAVAAHTHVIADVTGLQTALDGKLNLTGGTLTGALTVAYSSSPLIQVGIPSVLTESRVRLVNSNWTTGTDFVASSTAGSKAYGFFNRDRSAWDLQVDGNSGVVSGSFSGSLAGNASTATKLQTARTISLGGDLTGSASFDGSANVTINATVADNSHSHDYLPLTGGTLSGAVGAPRYNVGDDAYFADINAANTVAVRGAQNADVGYINFGPGGNALGSGSGQPLTFRSGGVAYHGSSTYGSAKITVSTSSPSGGVSGDIWLKV